MSLVSFPSCACPSITKRNPLVYPHLIGAYSIYLVCVHNTLLTPSTFKGAARLFHIWIGRIGLVLGVIGFITGAILVWFIYDYTVIKLMVTVVK